MVRHYPTPGQGQLHHLAQRDGLEIKQLARSLIRLLWVEHRGYGLLEIRHGTQFLGVIPNEHRIILSNSLIPTSFYVFTVFSKSLYLNIGYLNHTWSERTTELTECQAFSLVVWIGSPHRKRVLTPPPFGSNGGDTLAGEGTGVANSDEGADTLVLEV